MLKEFEKNIEIVAPLLENESVTMATYNILEELSYSEHSSVIFLLLISSFILSLIAVFAHFYFGITLSAMAKKMKLKNTWLAFVPFGNFFLASKMAKAHWWPIIMLSLSLVPIIGFFFLLSFSVYFIKWMWVIFKHFKRPAWWSVSFPFIVFPVINLLPIIFLAIVAWGDFDESKKEE